MIHRIALVALTAVALSGLSAPVPASAADADAAQASFESFAKTWVADLERDAKAGRSGSVRYVTYDPKGVEVTLQPTGNAGAPFVGTMTYTQDQYECQSAQQQKCQKVASEPVTEIFPYQDGRWRY